MIDFKDFGIEDTADYLSYLLRCAQISSNGSPLIALGYRKNLKLLRGYAENLCWHKGFIDDEEFWFAPVGDWDKIDWRNVFVLPFRNILSKFGNANSEIVFLSKISAIIGITFWT